MRSAIAISIVSFVVAALAVRWLSRGRIALDQPNSRSLHATPVPRTGGIGLLAGIGAGWAIGEPNWSWPLWAALILVVIVSLLDDLCNLSIVLRLAAHILAAVLVVPSALEPQASLMLLVFAVLATGWMCNLYNFMDGSDGLAGGMTLIGFLAYSAAAWFAGSAQFALLNLAVAAAAGGFLLFNFHPARIFLGDAGAVPLGFLAAVFGLIGWHQRDWAWWFPLLVFSPFIVDASVTLLRRLFSGARFWEAHRDHYYQRLVQLGLGHRGTALAEYALMSACALTALGAMMLPQWGQHAVLGGAGLLYLIVIARIEKNWRQRTVNA